jgi:hypothetical protein
MAGEFLVESYLQRVKSHLQGGQVLINRAISARRIIFDLVDINSRPTLATLINQFDSQGNKLKTATFRYLDKSLFESESQLYLRPTNMTDRERIALLSIFHCAADTIFTPLNETKRGTLQVLQIVVANRIRDVAGFTTPLGYEPNPKMISAIDTMMGEADALFEQCRIISALNTELANVIPRVSQLKNATKEKSLKHSFAVDLLAGIGEFARTHDFYKLFNAVKKVKDANKSASLALNLCVRETPVIEQINVIVMRYEPLFLKDKKLCASILSIFAQREKQNQLEMKLERPGHVSLSQL